ncbi:MAG: hypothetical protein ABIR66_10100 [Saprospiraceae bacterium]
MENVDKKYEIDKELEEISADLANILKNRTAKEIPFRYFEKLPDQVIHKINSTSREQVSGRDQILFILNTRRFQVLAFASLVGVIILASIIFTSSPQKEMNLAVLDDMEIRSYLLQNAADLDDDQLSLFKTIDNRIDLLNISEEELAPVMDEYLYQINTDELN